MSIFGRIGRILSVAKRVVPIKVHTHDIPRCGEGQTNVECKGPRIICRVMFKGDSRFCSCVHLKI